MGVWALRIIDHLFLWRPVVLVPVWGFGVLGYWRASARQAGPVLRQLWDRTHAPEFGKLVLFSCAVAAVYVLNQIADRETDGRNEGTPLFFLARISTRGAVTSMGCALICATIPFLFFDPLLVLFSLAGFVTGFVYSCRPTSFSGRPGADFLTNAIGFGIIAFGAGWYLADPQSLLSGRFVKAMLPYFFLMCAGSISSTLPDIPGDRATGKMTTAVVLGPARAHVLAMVMLLAALLLALRAGEWAALVAGGLAGPVYLWHAVRPTQRSMEATYKIGGAAVMAIPALCLPLFVLAGLVTFAVTWTYFRLRFGVTYPSLVPVAGTRK